MVSDDAANDCDYGIEMEIQDWLRWLDFLIEMGEGLLVAIIFFVFGVIGLTFACLGEDEY